MVSQGTVADLMAANKLVRLHRHFPENGLTFVPELLEPVVVTFTDASWATRCDGSSQGGQITVLLENKAVNGGQGRFPVLAWNSHRLRKVARSSTAAESQMVGDGIDFREFAKIAYMNMHQTETINLLKVEEVSRQFESYVVSGSKNVFDALARVETSGLQMEEKRTAVKLLGMKERLQQANVVVKWVAGDQSLPIVLQSPGFIP